MARAKKIVKYVPQTKMPAPGYEWRVLDKLPEVYTMNKVYSLLLEQNKLSNGDSWLANSMKDRMDSGYYTEQGWKDAAGKYTLKRILNRIWPLTEEYKTINDAFLKEYSEREDLQEIYRKYVNSRWYLYDPYGDSTSQNDYAKKGWDLAPEWYGMFLNVINGSEAGAEIELLRETPYQEGDIVLLRKSSIGRRGVDPLFEWRATPDASVDRYGTVMLVKEEVGHWRGGKGTKVISVLWFGTEQAKNVEERHLKWHERPTFKNGLKKRE